MIYAAPFTQGINEAGIFRAIANDTNGGLVFRNRHINHAFDMAASAAAINDIDITLDAAFQTFGVWLIGDIADGAANGAGAKQRALRSAQDFHTVQVIEVNIRGKE